MAESALAYNFRIVIVLLELSIGLCLKTLKINLVIN
jgi:hypothetical protein